MADLIQAIAKVSSFAKLAPGWDYGSGVPSSVATCSRARSVLTMLYAYGLSRFNVAPGSNGGITIAALQSPGNEIEVHCNANGSYDLFVTRDGEEMLDLEAISFTRLKDEFGGISWLSTKSSTWFTPNVICLTWEGSQAKHSRTHLTGQAYPLYVCNAQKKKAVAYVHTCEPTPEPTSAATHLYFGGFESVNSRVI